MTYEYKCKNQKCELYDVIQKINLPMSQSDKDVFCKCETKLQKLFFSSGIKTSDGYKSWINPTNNSTNNFY